LIYCNTKSRGEIHGNTQKSIQEYNTDANNLIEYQCTIILFWSFTMDEKSIDKTDKLLEFLEKKCSVSINGKYQASRSKISRELGLKLPELNQAITTLVVNGLLTVEIGEFDGRIQPNTYSLEPSPYYLEMMGVQKQMQKEICK
jgi:DNA replication protein DnaD